MHYYFHISSPLSSCIRLLCYAPVILSSMVASGGGAVASTSPIKVVRMLPGPGTTGTIAKQFLDDALFNFHIIMHYYFHISSPLSSCIRLLCYAPVILSSMVASGGGAVASTSPIKVVRMLPGPGTTGTTGTTGTCSLVLFVTYFSIFFTLKKLLIWGISLFTFSWL